MDTNATDPGSRVTRSLRKRIASVDSDNSSRPGTPVSSKLVPISEISASPSRSTRMTRRNSTSGVSTPVKTPAKRVVSTSIIVENAETPTPARRSTRRRSVSVHENDETSQTGLKIPTFAPLDEEISATEQNTSRTTRLQSKSPQQIKSSKAPSPSPKLTKSHNETIDKELHEEATATEHKTFRTTRSQSKSPQQVTFSKALSPTRKLSKSPNQNNKRELDEEIAATEQNTSRLTRSLSKSSNASSPSPKPTKIPNENENKQLDEQKRSKPGTKSKTAGKEKVSDIKISVLENEMEEIKNKSSNITIIVLTDDESNQIVQEDTNEDNKIHQNTEKSFLEKFDSQLSEEINVTKSELLNIKEAQVEENTNKSTSYMRCTEQEIISKNATVTNIDILNKTIGVTSEQKENEESKSSSQNIDSKIHNKHTLADQNQVNNTNVENTTDDINNTELENNAKNLEENEINSSIDKDLQFKEKDTNDMNFINVKDCSTQNTNEKPDLANKIEIISISTLATFINENKEDSEVSNCEASSKKVDFASSPSNDMTIKNVYPKTPASMKTPNSFIDANSSRDNDGSCKTENNTMTIHSDNKQNVTIREDMHEINDEKIENKQKEEHSQIETKETPIRVFKCVRLLQIVQNSTPINIEESKPEEILLSEEEIPITETDVSPINEEMKDETIEAHINDEGPSSIHHQSDGKLKWINPSVKGTTLEGFKLDSVVKQKETSSNDCRDNVDSFVEHVKPNKKKSIIFSSEEEEMENVEIEQDYKYDDNDGECELAPGEKPYKRKHDFHDDEAMEVDDYESGDSMDSEEGREMEENEIPIDGESIGSHTTVEGHEEYVDEMEEDSENSNSFIVSDNEELECSESDDEDEVIDEEINEHNRKKKTTYKRIQCPTESSSSSDEEVEILPSQEKLARECSDVENINEENPVKSRENVILDSSKLSDSALRLHCSAESESDEEEGVDERKMNISGKEILRKLNQSDRFNKSVRDLNPEINTSPVELEYKTSPGIIQGNISNAKLESSDEELTTSISPEEITTRNNNKLQSESQVSVTSESDADKENGHKNLILPCGRKPDSELSVSFGNYKKAKIHSKGRQEWQRSFTIDVTVKDGDLETAVTDVKLKEDTVSASSSSTDEQENEQLIGENLRYLENIKHMPLPLGNPLIRTRRQSLALPTNPDMEICSSYGGGSSKKSIRKSLGILSGSDFNPSQSFIDSIELYKSELNRQVAKRKRLSKSFCGASETLDNSIIDIDVRHLHKRSKLAGENSIAESQHDSIENINNSKLCTKICSTPHGKTDKNESNNNIQHILTRCDEILEAANRAKLQAKINNKQSNKGKVSKKLRKKSISTLPKESDPEDALRRVSKEIKHKVKTKTALSQAIKAADVILGKKKQTQLNMEEQDGIVSKQLPSDVLEAIEKSAPMKKKYKKGNTANVHTTLTSAGNFMDMPQTPEKKIKPTYIQLPTGKVSVEPVTPKKRSVLAFNGAKFRESPITPYAIGFKVRQISLTENNESSLSFLKNGKRKRHHDEKSKERTLPKSQWTQSGLFIEENISKNCNIKRSDTSHLCTGSQKTKIRLLKREEQTINRNFKENAIMRPDIKRSTKREILLLKERRQIQGRY